MRRKVYGIPYTAMSALWEEDKFILRVTTLYRMTQLWWCTDQGNDADHGRYWCVSVRRSVTA